MLQVSKKPGELDNAMWDEISTENGVFESGHWSDTVVSTVARRDEENTKSGISCGQPYGRIDSRMQHCSMSTVARHYSSARIFWIFTARMLPACLAHGILRGVYLSVFRAF